MQASLFTRKNPNIGKYIPISSNPRIFQQIVFLFIFESIFCEQDSLDTNCYNHQIIKN